MIEDLNADSLTVATATESFTFRWIGDPLDGYFVEGQSVHISTESVKVAGSGPPLLSSVSSDSITLSVIDGTAQGLPAVIAVADLPELRYALRQCCDSDGILICDYSDLTVVLDDEEVTVQRGATASIGSWLVTNLWSTYLRHGESAWSVRATLVKQ